MDYKKLEQDLFTNLLIKNLDIEELGNKFDASRLSRDLTRKKIIQDSQYNKLVLDNLDLTREFVYEWEVSVRFRNTFGCFIKEYKINNIVDITKKLFELCCLTPNFGKKTHEELVDIFIIHYNWHLPNFETVKKEGQNVKIL